MGFVLLAESGVDCFPDSECDHDQPDIEKLVVESVLTG
jgi:hypothetical protein